MLYPIFYFKNVDFCIFTPKTLLVKENYFLTLWNFTNLKDTSFGKKSCNFEYGLETKNEFEKWPLITFFSVELSNIMKTKKKTKEKQRSLSNSKRGRGSAKKGNNSVKVDPVIEENDPVNCAQYMGRGRR